MIIGINYLKKEQNNMSNHNFILGPVDTDSVSFSKPDMSPISKEEQISLIKEINQQFPELIQYAPDGYYDFCICIRAKNYILKDFDGKVTIKGSSLKSPLKQPALKEFINEIIYSILDEKFNYEEIYNKYVKEIMNLTDIKRWASKKSLTQTVLNGTRSNETKVMDAIVGTEYTSGDKLFLYYTEEGILKLVENYNNDHSKDRLLKALHDTSKIFSTIIPKETFCNYSLKRSKEKLEEITSL